MQAKKKCVGGVKIQFILIVCFVNKFIVKKININGTLERKVHKVLLFVKLRSV